MTRVIAIILHSLPLANAGPLETAFGAMRAANARRLARGFERTGAEAIVEEVRPGGAPFGSRLRTAAVAHRGAGLVVLGSGSIPLASPADLRAMTDAASKAGPILTNNRYSSDVVAIPAAVAEEAIARLPDLTADNGLPRWLSELGFDVVDLGRRWRLQVDLDSPIDGFLAGFGHDVADVERVALTAARLRELVADPEAQLVVAGRTSSSTLRWLERSTASRSRVLIEERGMRTATQRQKPARSVVGLLLDRHGPRELGAILAQLGDGAILDSRVLLAHRLGVDESAWPPPEDRFASDLLLHEQVRDPWLRDLTRAAADAPIPVLLGGHTLVGPGLRLLLGAARR